MKIVAIGDVHGSFNWIDVVIEHFNSCDKFIFLGDYFDPYHSELVNTMVDNFKAILEYKKHYPDKFILLRGNHDWHYISNYIERSTRYNLKYKNEISKILLDNKSLMTDCYQIGSVVFTHAGIQHNWFVNSFKGNIDESISDQINKDNKSEKELLSLFQIGWMRGGDHDVGGPFWIDKRELVKPLKGFIQIVGHNRVEKPIHYEHNGGEVYFCDCLFNNKYLKFEYDSETKKFELLSTGSQD